METRDRSKMQPPLSNPQTHMLLIHKEGEWDWAVMFGYSHWKREIDRKCSRLLDLAYPQTRTPLTHKEGECASLWIREIENAAASL